MLEVLIFEEASGVARMFCVSCLRPFRAYLDRVTSVGNYPLCLDCVVRITPMRKAFNLPPPPLDRAAYLPD